MAGKPAAAVPLSLHGPSGVVAEGQTGDDGRCRLSEHALAVGTYTLVFDTGTWFAARGVPAFYPEVTITFIVADPDAHLHVPLLLSPFAYSTYRGS